MAAEYPNFVKLAFHEVGRGRAAISKMTVSRRAGDGYDRGRALPQEFQLSSNCRQKGRRRGIDQLGPARYCLQNNAFSEWTMPYRTSALWFLELASFPQTTVLVCYHFFQHFSRFTRVTAQPKHQRGETAE